MSKKIFTDNQVKRIQTRVESLGNWKHEPNLERRRNVSQELRRMFKELDLGNGGSVDRKSFCDMVALQWKIQNLNPMSMPELLGSYHYKKHFGDFQGTEDEFKNLREEKTGSRDIYPGADLNVVSEALNLMAKDSRDERAAGAEKLRSVKKAGQALVSGFLYLLYPDQYGIVNSPTKTPFLNKGWLGVTAQQRGTATEKAKARLDLPEQISAWTFKTVLRWFEMFREIKDVCELDDYHEVDHLLWYISTDEESKEKVDFQELMAAADPNEYEVRSKSERRARELIKDNLGTLEADQVTEVFDSINTCLGKSGINYTRFGPAFIGNNVKKVFENLNEFNELVVGLWNANDDQIIDLLNQFWASDSLGKSRSLPSLILYLKDNQKYGVWTEALDKALYRVTLGIPSKTTDGFSYLQYCNSLQHLRNEVGFQPELHDWVLFKLMQTKPDDKKKPPKQSGKFKGFTLDTFAFMQELKENNTQTWFNNHKDRFKSQVDQPLRALVGDIGVELISQLDAELETSPKSRKCISNIRKNVWGKKEEDVYQELYWAAFYRREKSRNGDCQLYISIWPDRLTSGLYFGDQADDVKEQFHANLHKRKDLAEEIVSQINEHGLLVSGKEVESVPVLVNVETADQLIEIVANERIHIFRDYSPDDAVEGGIGLKDKIKTDMEFLYQVFKLAVSENPTSLELEFGVGPGGGNDDSTLIAIEDLCDATFMEPEFFQTLDLYLEDKQQLIFHGPPGTGKTYVALKYAEYLTQESGEVKTVQFHPSYGYEDFIEGLRPTTDDKGLLSYKVEAGIFKRLCEQARSDPKSKFVLIIDEINRGNIPRIFGELMFLLERRDQTTDLPFSKKPFSIPRNIVVIGTMNSTDRSIALMDLALRRRFHFVEMHPRKEVLLAWLHSNKKPKHVVDLFVRLNESLAKDGIDDERLVGHAHFMTPSLSDEFLPLIWTGTIEPLMKEYFFADTEKANRYLFDEFVSGYVKGDDETEDELDEDDEYGEDLDNPE